MYLKTPAPQISFHHGYLLPGHQALDCLQVPFSRNVVPGASTWHSIPDQNGREMIWYTQSRELSARKRDKAGERKAKEEPWAEQQRPRSRSSV
jgi:hypothetical protein